MNGYIIDLTQETGEEMIVNWAQVEGGAVVSVEYLPVVGEFFTPDFLRAIFETDADADDLNLADWSGNAGDAQYLDGPIDALLAANDATLIKRRIVAA